MKSGAGKKRGCAASPDKRNSRSVRSVCHPPANAFASVMRRSTASGPVLAVLLAITPWTCAAGSPTDSAMKSSDHSAAASCAIAGEKSACGLPSNVAIDMSQARVQHTDAEWRALLSPEQYRVARQQGTEPHSTTPIGTTPQTASTFPFAATPRYSTVATSSKAAPAGQVSPSRSSPSSSPRNAT